MSGTRQGGRVHGVSDGVSLTWSSRTPAPSRWVVVDQEVYIEDADDGWKGFELGWAPDGTEGTARRFATFDTSDCLTWALLAIEDDPREATVEALVANAGFGPPVTSDGVTAWSTALADGSEVSLEHGPDEVSVATRRPGRVGFDFVASASLQVARRDLASYGDPVLTAFLAVVAAFLCTTADGYMGR